MSSTGVPAVASFSLTHVEYEAGDAIGFLFAGLSLAPVFLIVALVTATIARRDLHIGTALLGQLLNTVFNIILKRIIRQPRPPFMHARGEPAAAGFSPYGMPSNHSQFVCFFAAYWCSYLLWNKNNHAARYAKDSDSCTQKQEGGHLCHSIIRPAATICILLGALLVSAGRVYLTYHTTAQVLIGAVVGTIAGKSWYAITWNFIAPTIFPKLAKSQVGFGLGIVNATHTIGNDVRADIVHWEYRSLSRSDRNE